MDNIHIEPGDFTPEVDFDFSNNRFVVRGESYPENAVGFYETPLKSLFDHLAAQLGMTIVFVFDLTYFGSSSAKLFVLIMEKLETYAAAGNTVSVEWVYETGDDKMKEIGEDLGEDLTAASFVVKAR